MSRPEATTTPRRATAVLWIVLLSYLMIVLDISIFITAPPRMWESLGFTPTGLWWVQNAYTLAFGGLLLLGARAGDIVGRRRMFTIGIAIFTVASLAVGLAPSPAWLVAARAVQGLGAAVLAMLVAAPRFLPETTPRPGSLDLVGALCSTLGMTSFVYGIVRSADHGWGDGITVTALALGVVLLSGLVLNERRVRQPIMPLRLFGDREQTGAYAGRVLCLGTMLGFWFFVTQFLQGVYQYTPLHVPTLPRQWDNARVLAAGVAITLVGMAWLSRLTADTPYVTGLALPMILLGIGQGASLGPLTAAGIARVGAEDAGAASGLVNVAHQLGGSLGLGILVTVFAAANSDGYAGSALVAHQVSAALTAGAGLLAPALVVVLTLIVGRRPGLTASHTQRTGS